MTKTNATHDMILNLFETEFAGLTTADISFAIGVLEAMKLGIMLEEGRITHEEYMEALFS